MEKASYISKDTKSNVNEIQEEFERKSRTKYGEYTVVYK